LVANRNFRAQVGGKARSNYLIRGAQPCKEEVLRELLEGVGIDPASIHGDEIKNQLRANTDEAASRGAFGPPDILVERRDFLGQRSLRFCRGCAESILVKFDSLVFVR
jgi:hypothetical protein